MKRLPRTQGCYDLVGVIDAPENEPATVDLGAGLAGPVRTETLRAYHAEAMDRILAKLSNAPLAATPLTRRPVTSQTLGTTSIFSRGED